MVKLPGHTPLDLLPCPAGRSDEHLWRDDWQTPLLYPSGNHRKPLCSAPGEKEKSLLNDDYSFSKCMDEHILEAKETPRIRSPAQQPKGNQESALVQDSPLGLWHTTTSGITNMTLVSLREVTQIKHPK